MEISQIGLRNQQIIMTIKEAEDLCRMIRIGVDSSKSKYNYHPKTKEELMVIVNELIKERGNEANLNDIDVSQIKDMSWLFVHSEFNGDISKWDVGKVESMHAMFRCSEFNGDISKWDVSKVEDMCGMFGYSKFNSDISNWDVSGVEDMRGMFYCSKFNGDISKWAKKPTE